MRERIQSYSINCPRVFGAVKEELTWFVFPEGSAWLLNTEGQNWECECGKEGEGGGEEVSWISIYVSATLTQRSTTNGND